jgi:hypothetical protein
VLRGNVPNFLRRFVPVTLTNAIDGEVHRLTVRVAPDYLAVGSDVDYLLMPLSPTAANRIAEATDCQLPTRQLVDAIHAAAPLKLVPQPIAPSPEMTTLPVFAHHNELVWEQRRAALAAFPLGTLVAGHKKDVVTSARLVDRPGRVAIYGWHQTNGVPIQPLYLGHSDSWVDYSHGIRLVSRTARLDGVERSLPDILAAPVLPRSCSRPNPDVRPRPGPHPCLENGERSRPGCSSRRLADWFYEKGTARLRMGSRQRPRTGPAGRRPVHASRVRFPRLQNRHRQDHARAAAGNAMWRTPTAGKALEGMAVQRKLYIRFFELFLA